MGRGGPGEVGLSVWLGLAAGLTSGLSSSGGVGVLAKRSGPESLKIKLYLDVIYCTHTYNTKWSPS